MHSLRAAVGTCLLLVLLGACDDPQARTDVAADSAAHVRELVEDLPAVVDVRSERVELDSEYWGVETEVHVEPDIAVSDLAAVVEVLDDAERLVDEEGGFHGVVRFVGDDDDQSSFLASGGARTPEEQAAAFLAAVERFPGAEVMLSDWALEIRSIDPEGRTVTELATEISDDPAIAAMEVVSIGVHDTVEGGGNTTLTTDLPAVPETIAAWQAVVDTAATFSGGASVEYVNLQMSDGQVDRLELNLLGVGASDIPDFATWHPVLAPPIDALADLAAERGTDATLKVMTDNQAFVLVDVEPPADPSEYADPTWNQSVVDHLASP